MSPTDHADLGAQPKTLEQLLDEIEARDGTTAQTAAPTPSPSDKGGSAENPLAGLMSSPQLLQVMGKLPAILSAVGGGGAAGHGNENVPQKKDTPDAQALLCALRPYLNERRRGAVDSMMQFWKIRALLRTIRPE
ncbi:MAG: hypothetical protein IJW40_00935 [Clostridia bacterium]|nr:hypothetical protein [Clostridia bacterium]